MASRAEGLGAGVFITSMEAPIGPTRGSGETSATLIGAMPGHQLVFDLLAAGPAAARIPWLDRQTAPGQRRQRVIRSDPLQQRLDPADPLAAISPNSAA